jgi:hypothetical protein
MAKDYGSSKGSDKGKGKGYAGCEDARLSSERPWDVPSGSPEAPGEAKKIPRPK